VFNILLKSILGGRIDEENKAFSRFVYRFRNGANR
ncbi:MAG: hypothetical protein UV22_C0036G0010, partial [Parcubacteria group bacterium GW2011_GWA2_42_35]